MDELDQNYQETAPEEMRCALAAIANEMQLFHVESLALNETQKDPTLVDDVATLLKYKNALKLKKEQIKMLRHNLKTACTVAKTLAAAKESKTTILNNQLNAARNQYLDLVKQEKVKSNMVDELKAENQTLQDKLQCFNNFIRLGYQELQNIRNESVENISSLKQLQAIITCCSQYYAEHHNQIEKCTLLEQKNRFLTSKLSILESQLEATWAELQNLRGKTKRNHRAKDESPVQQRQCRNMGVVCSDYQLGHHTNLATIGINISKIELQNNSLQSINSSSGSLDLTRHLSTVKKLLLDQDTLIKDLKCLSMEIESETFMG